MSGYAVLLACSDQPKDVSLYYGGFHADLNATYPVGKIDDDSKKLIRTTRQALDAAIAMCKPGALIRDIGKVMYVARLSRSCQCIELIYAQRAYC